jgi:hypothetical protein
MQPVSMAREEYETCPQCGTGNMKPTGGVGTVRDEEKDIVTEDYREYQCDNPACRYPIRGRAKTAQVTEGMNMEESVKTSSGSDKKYQEQG